MIAIGYKIGEKPELITEKKESKILKFLQNYVGGYIESIHLSYSDTDELVLICNEDGRLMNLKENRNLLGCMIVGNFLICRINSKTGKFKNVNASDIRKYLTEVNV